MVLVLQCQFGDAQFPSIPTEAVTRHCAVVGDDGLKHQKDKRILLGWTIGQGDSVYIVNDTGRIVREVKVVSEPDVLLKVLGNPARPTPFERIGLEAGLLSQWLFSALAEAELPVVCVETRSL
jgi:hypothetical protein